MASDSALPDEMKAVRCHGIMDYRLERVPVAQLTRNQLLVKVLRCGICAGDSKCWRGAPRFWGNETLPRYVRTPVVPGHEFVGTVVDAGEGALKHHNVEIGDLVTAEQTNGGAVACGECLYCVKGLRWLCGPHDIFGFLSGGGICQYMIFPEKARVYKMQRCLPAGEAVYVEPLSCAVHGVDRAEIGFGDTVVVSGCGPIGLGMVAAARMRAPSRLVALDYSDSRLELARECGADVCINARKENVVKRVQEMTGGYGCDVYLEATGNPESVANGMEACRKAATFLEFSVFKKPTVLDWTVIGDLKELNIKGGHCSGENGYRVAIEMIESGRMPVDRIVTHGLPLRDTVAGLEMVDAGADSPANSVKVSIDPTIE